MNSLITLSVYHLLSIFFLCLLCRIGWKALGFGVLANMIMIPVVAQKQVEIFGYITNLGIVPYANVIFGVTILAMKYDMRGVLRMVTATYIGLLSFLVFGKLYADLPILYGNEQYSAVLLRVFENIGQISVATLLAFYAASITNTVIMHRFMRPPWVLKIWANTAAQAVDSIVFGLVAFLGALSLRDILVSALVGFLFKAYLNVIDTPLLSFATSMLRERDEARDLLTA